MKCKECKKQVVIEVKQALISIRYPNKAIEIVVNDVCLECLLKALKSR